MLHTKVKKEKSNNIAIKLEIGFYSGVFVTDQEFEKSTAYIKEPLVEAFASALFFLR